MSSIASAVSDIRVFHPDSDAAWLHRLWHNSMHSRWSLSIEAMLGVLAGARLSLVAERDGLRVGFCAVDYVPSGDAGLLVLLVEPAHQRQGIGSALLLEVEEMLNADHVGTLRLGALSTGTYFWPGMPAENTPAWPFFAKHGWHQQEACADLVQELTSFRTPLWVSDRLSQANIGVRLADPGLRDQVAEFERIHFPAWFPFVENELANSGENLLIAQTADEAIVGTILIKARIRALWASDSGIQAGSLNILGVAPVYQRQGIGLALAARALEILRERGCSRCYIQWTGLNEWYGKLGARVWTEYRMASKELMEQSSPETCSTESRSRARGGGSILPRGIGITIDQSV